MINKLISCAVTLYKDPTQSRLFVQRVSGIRNLVFLLELFRNVSGLWVWQGGKTNKEECVCPWSGQSLVGLFKLGEKVGPHRLHLNKNQVLC